MRLIRTEKDWFDSLMKIKEVATRMPYTVSPEILVTDAKKKMQEYQIRHLPVLDQGELVGIISDRDIRTGESFQGPGFLSVGDVMTRKPYTVSPSEPLSQVLTVMIERKIGSALVQSPTGVVVGIFTPYDALAILRALILLGEREREGDLRLEQVQNYEEPTAA